MSYRVVLKSQEGDKLHVQIDGKDYPEDRIYFRGTVSEKIEENELELELYDSENERKVSSSAIIILTADTDIHGAKRVQAWRPDDGRRLLISAVLVRFIEDND